MERFLLSLVIVTATASAVAAPPYEPLPDRQPDSSLSKKSATSSAVNYSSAKEATNASAPSNSNITPMWDLYSQVQQMQQEVQALRGVVEELGHQVDVMQKQARERYLDLDLRINQIRDGAASGAGSQSSALSLEGDDKTLYQQASDLRKKDNYIGAIQILDALLKRSPDGLYAPYSDYWLGELYMAISPQDLEAAKKHFIHLLANYADHVKVPDAMYKLGKLYAQQKQEDKARSTWTALVEKYPEKSAAKLAKDALKGL